MITYRPHKGLLSDSMKDKKKFNTLQDLLEYIVEDHNTEIPYFQICIDDLNIKMYGDGGDKRVGWKDLFAICYESYDRIADKIGYDRYFNGEHYDHPCGVIGFFTTAQPKPVNSLTKSDMISKQKVKYKLTALVNEIEEIFANIREREVDDSVCGLCEYDGAYIGQSGDWCYECPGFEKDNCFKLKDKYRAEWESIDG